MLVIFANNISVKMQRHVIHCDLDTFFVSVERLVNSRLNGKPVLIGGGSDRGVVASCSYEARRFGVHSAMPMKLALRLCPEAVVVRGDYDRYAYHSNLITEIIEEVTPVVEKASIDEHYLDVSGMDRFFGCWKWAQELRNRIIKESGLPISFGLSGNKTVSKIATGEAKPCGERLVAGGLEKDFLAPLSIRKIPMVGDRAYGLLRNMGINRIKTLQELEVFAMRRVLGENGVTIWRKANGIDDNPVVPFRKQKSMSKETTFHQDSIDMLLMRRILLGMVDHLCYQLRQEQKLTGCVSVKIRYSNFDTHNQQLRIPYTSSERVIQAHVFELFKKLYSRRMLIRLIGVKFSNLINGSCQIDLFNTESEELSLLKAVDRIRSRYGEQSILRAACLNDRQTDAAEPT